jgi:hypothetical protein
MKRLVFLIGLYAFALSAHAALSVSSAKQISSVRIGQTLYEYTYQVTVRNTGPSVTNVKAFVSSALPNVTVLDDLSVVGDLGSGLRVTSPDTVKIRVDRSQPFRSSDLRWTVGLEATLRLQGRVRTALGPLPDAAIEVRIDRSRSPRAASEYGRPLLESTFGVADATGNFSIDVPVITDDEFLVVLATGSGSDTFVRLGSLLRSAEGLLDLVQRAGSAPVAPFTYPLAVTALPALDVTSLSTGVAIVLSDSAPGEGPVSSDADLAAAERRSDAAQMLERAAAIELARERGAASLPSGAPDTLELAGDNAFLRAFLAPIEIATPGATNSAAALVTATLSVPYTRASARADWLLMSLDRDFALATLRTRARLNLQGSNVFEATTGSGKYGGSWTVDADGRVVASYTTPVNVGTFFESKAPCDPTDPSPQIETQVVLESHTVSRLWAGLVADQVVDVQQVRTSYPGNACYPDVVAAQLGVSNAVTGLRSRDALPYTTTQLSGRTIGLVMQHPLFGKVASTGYNAEIRYLRLPLLADGTGSVPVRTQDGVQTLDYTWTVTTEKHLLISFADGTSNRLMRVGDSGPFQSVANYAEFPVGSKRNGGFIGTPLAYAELPPTFVNEDIANNRLRSRLNYFENLPSLSPKGEAVFDFLFRADGTGCTIQSDASGQLFQENRRLPWQVDANGHLDYTRDHPNAAQPDQRRLWRLVAIEERDSRTYYWVDEQLQFYFPSKGEAPPDFSDSPGRLTMWEVVGDASACVLP